MEDSPAPVATTGYLKVVSPDEQEFIDKHVVNKNKDRNGNDDEVFKASNIKRALRKPTRHGYEPGEDAKVYEEKESKPQWNSKERDYALKRKATLDDEKKKKDEEEVKEAKMTPAQLKKREEVAKAMEREHPGMPMAKKMAIATSVALKEEGILKPVNKITDAGRFGVQNPNKASDGLRVKDKNTGDNIHIGLGKPYKATVTSSSGEKKTFNSSSDLKSHLNQKKSGMSESVIGSYSRASIIDRVVDKYVPNIVEKTDFERFDEKIQNVPSIYRSALLETFENLSERNQNLMLERAETSEGINDLIDFIIRMKSEN